MRLVQTEGAADRVRGTDRRARKRNGRIAPRARQGAGRERLGPGRAAELLVADDRLVGVGPLGPGVAEEAHTGESRDDSPGP